MNKKTSFPNNKTALTSNAMQDEPINESKEQNAPTKARAKITPMSKDPLMGIF